MAKSKAKAAKPKTPKLRAEPDREPRDQFAALPWRRNADGAVEVLLITSRETRRWVIPKGWPIKGLTAAKTAAREAYEEAGVSGDVAKKKLGAFHYDKRLASGRLQHVKVTVYALRVEREADAWPEKGQRDRQWTAPADAAAAVDEPELQALIAAFKPA
ncbi:NUDIX hydrolase [Phenylobacterium sp.]|jgi:8-oxo-dGTP pyrophosphatase MutT (NUDIX family)|uniref:NUDIX hydrolase n=1 Tax=Phenylobacterium sp. TaxID=1871053 RepID=UPI00378509F0